MEWVSEGLPKNLHGGERELRGAMPKAKRTVLDKAGEKMPADRVVEDDERGHKRGVKELLSARVLVQLHQ